MQLVELVHDTPVRPLSVTPGRFGLATIFQLDPFHCSTKVLSAELSDEFMK